MPDTKLRESRSLWARLGHLSLPTVLLLGSSAPLLAQLAIGGIAGAGARIKQEAGAIGGSNAFCSYAFTATSVCSGLSADDVPDFSPTFGAEVGYRWKGLIGGILAQKVE